jgi:hypothetical protein
VAAAQQRDDEPLEQVILPDDDPLDLVEQPLHRRRPVVSVWWSTRISLVGG